MNRTFLLSLIILFSVISLTSYAQLILVPANWQHGNGTPNPIKTSVVLGCSGYVSIKAFIYGVNTQTTHYTWKVNGQVVSSGTGKSVLQANNMNTNLVLSPYDIVKCKAVWPLYGGTSSSVDTETIQIQSDYTNYYTIAKPKLSGSISNGYNCSNITVDICGQLNYTPYELTYLNSSFSQPNLVRPGFYSIWYVNNTYHSITYNSPYNPGTLSSTNGGCLLKTINNLSPSDKIYCVLVDSCLQNKLGYSDTITVSSLISVPQLTSRSLNCNTIVIEPTSNKPSNERWYWQGNSCGTSTSFGDTDTFIATQSGTYYIRAYNTTINCWSPYCRSINITSSPSPSFSLTLTNATCSNCSDGTITLIGSGGTPPYQYSIDSGSFWQSSNVFSNISIGTYPTLIKDSKNCTSQINQVTISGPQLPPQIVSIDIQPGRNIKAGQGSAFSANVTGSPTQWLWEINGLLYSETKTFNSSYVSTAFPVADIYKVTLTVTNSAGQAVAEDIFVVEPTATNPSNPNPQYTTKEDHPSEKVSDPIDASTGAYTYRKTDFQIASYGKNLVFRRYYNTVNTSRNSPVGYGWSHSYNIYIEKKSDNLWIAHHGDGHQSFHIPYIDSNGLSFALFGGAHEKLSRDATSKTYQLTFKNGEQYNFDSSGVLSNITDRNGNTTNFTYSNDKLAKVTAPNGRTLIFSYTGSYLSKVEDQLSRALLFTYDTSGNLISVTDAQQGATKFGYDTRHNIVYIINPRGDTLLSNIFDSSDRVIVQTDAYQQQTKLDYNTPNNGDVTITFPDNKTEVVHHDSFYRSTYDKDELGHIVTNTYDYNNNPLNIKDENGNVTHITYDSLSNPLSIEMPGNTTTSIAYNTYSQPIKIVNALNDTTTFNYDTTGNLTQIQLPNNASEEYIYNSKGQIISTKDALGRVVSFGYNSAGDITSITAPHGTQNRNYDTIGRLISLTNENGYTSTYQYNKRDQLTVVTDPLGHKIIDSFDANGKLVHSTDKNGNTTTLEYDKKDRLTKITLPNGGITIFTYDVRDNIASITDANGNTTTYGYDGKNRLTSITNALGTSTIAYDNVGNRISETDATNRTLYYTYDSLNRLVQTKDAISNVTAYTRNALGQVRSVKDPLNRETKYQYDALGYIKQITDAANNNSSTDYDAIGNLKSITDPNGHTQHIGYDSSNRLTSHRDAESNLDSFVNDGVGNIIQIIKPTGTITRAYDSANRLVSVNNSTGDNYAYTYDPNGNILSIQNNAGTAYFTYNAINKVTRHIDVFGDTVKYSYDSVGNRTSIIYPNNKTVTYTYNAINKIESVTDWQGHVTQYYYDAAGRKTARVNPYNDTCKYEYDAAGRLISKTNIIADSIISQNIFTLNAAGEKISEQITGPRPFHLKQSSYAYTYEDNDALTSDSVTSYTNNGAGNRLSGKDNYNFTVDNLLKSTSNNTYIYDALGNRIGKTDTNGFRRHLVDLTGELSQVLQERDTNGVLIASYIYGDGLLSLIDSAGDIYYYHFDAQHNTVALSDDSGKVTDTYVYEPFGKLLEHTGSTEQLYTFLGEYGVQQEAPNLYYVRARYYDAQNHRFLSEDPYPSAITNPQTLNRYVYALNNPISLFDPTGLVPDEEDKPNYKVVSVITYIMEIDAKIIENSLIKTYNSWEEIFPGDQLINKIFNSGVKISSSIGRGLNTINTWVLPAYETAENFSKWVNNQINYNTLALRTSGSFASIATGVYVGGSIGGLPGIVIGGAVGFFVKEIFNDLEKPIEPKKYWITNEANNDAW